MDKQAQFELQKLHAQAAANAWQFFEDVISKLQKDNSRLEAIIEHVLITTTDKFTAEFIIENTRRETVGTTAELGTKP